MSLKSTTERFVTTEPTNRGESSGKIQKSTSTADTVHQRHLNLYQASQIYSVTSVSQLKEISSTNKHKKHLKHSRPCDPHSGLGFTFDHWIDPVDIVHHSSVNPRFSEATAALPPADDPIQEADIILRAGQGAPRVALEKHTTVHTHKHTGTDQSTERSWVTHSYPDVWSS